MELLLTACQLGLRFLRHCFGLDSDEFFLEFGSGFRKLLHWPITTSQHERGNVRAFLSGAFEEINGPIIHAAERIPFAEDVESSAIVIILLEGFAGLEQLGVEFSVLGWTTEVAELEEK